MAAVRQRHGIWMLYVTHGGFARQIRKDKDHSASLRYIASSALGLLSYDAKVNAYDQVNLFSGIKPNVTITALLIAHEF